MFGVHVVKAQLALVPLRVAVLPRAANDGLEPLRVLAAHRVVDAHQAAAALEELIEILALLRRDGARLGGEHHQHVDLLQLRSGGEIHRAIHLRAAFGEQLCPLAEEARVVVLAGAVRLHTATDENAERLGGLEGKGKNDEQREAKN